MDSFWDQGTSDPGIEFGEFMRYEARDGYLERSFPAHVGRRSIK